MQYLECKFCEFTTAAAQKNEPYCVQSILQSPLPRLTTHKILHKLQLVYSTSLNSTGVVEDKTIVICEHEFVLDAVEITLRAGFSRSAVANGDKYAQPPS